MGAGRARSDGSEDAVGRDRPSRGADDVVPAVAESIDDCDDAVKLPGPARQDLSIALSTYGTRQCCDVPADFDFDNVVGRQQNRWNQLVRDFLAEVVVGAKEDVQQVALPMLLLALIQAVMRQDLWMLLSGDHAEMTRQLSDVLSGYRDFYEFDPRELHLVEALRTLRLIHYSAWLARRWDDPAFPAAFPWFNTQRYWEDRILELREQVGAMEEGPLWPV